MTDSRPHQPETSPDPPGQEPPDEELLLRLILASTGVGLYEWDLTTDVVRYLTTRGQEWGQPLKWLLTSGAEWFVLAHPEDQAEGRAVVERSIAGGPDEFVLRMRIPRGPEREGWAWIQSRSRVVRRDDAGRATYVLGSYQDITEIIHQQELQRERDAALDLALRRASLGALTASLAHEINQPLAALTSFAEAAARLLANGAPASEVDAALKRTVELARRSSEIVRRMQRLARHAPPLIEDVPFPDTLRSVRDQVAREARTARVQVHVTDAPDTWTIKGDRLQIEQLLINLTRNAIEAASSVPGQAGLVTLSAEAGAEGTAIRVTDNGPGIAADQAAHIFEPFFTTKPTGTGLGLTVSTLIVEAHGGAVRLDRTGPDGTVFVVTLPAGA